MKKEAISNKRFASEKIVHGDVYSNYYDAMTKNHVEDLPMYQQIVTTVRPPYLEVGCGTGRVLLDLLSTKPEAAQGHYLTGVDISETMLSICKKKTTRFVDDKSLRLMKHDFSINEYAGQKFNAAFITFFTFNYVPENLQMNFLENINKALHSGSLILLDCFFPHFKWHPEKSEQWVDNEPLIVNDRHIGFRQKTQMVSPTIEKTEWMFIEPDGASNVTSRSKTYVSPQQCADLLRTTGFTNIQRLSNYKTPSSNNFTEDPEGFNFVLTARKQ